MARFKFLGDGGGGGAAWNEIMYGDASSAAGSYGLTYSAGSGGFAHRIEIDDAANSYYLDTTTCASVYFDTGITYADLAAYTNTTIGFAITFDLDSTHAQATDNNAFLNFGPYMGDNTTLANNTVGGWSGLIFTNGSMRPATNVYRFVNDTTAGIGINLFNDFSYSTDSMTGMALDSSIRLGTSTNSGPQGISIGYQYKVGKTTLAGDRYTNQRGTTPVSTSNVILGVMFGQRNVGAIGTGQNKIVDFSMFYNITSR